ncbi:putative gamma-glutamylcyclotransferase CG2811 isoform X2 [Anabrus simplex]|uniref:putative gamma-glutamylcyclotransferase CG2811 isoform X2 n=1 Tax=Anabrus simplex TaxID=316456 RepID=UPI0034DCD1A8
MTVHKVFVYGTLKCGEPNHHWLTDKSKGIAKYFCKAETVKNYPLVIGTKYNIPFLLDSPGCGNNVIGEVYEVDQPMLEQLDILEDHPNFYVRRIEDVRVMDNKEGLVINCWIYFLQNFKPGMLKQELFKEYSSSGPHGLKYLERFIALRLPFVWTTQTRPRKTAVRW